MTATTTFVATATNAQAYAYLLEGYAFGVAQVASITPTATATPTAAANTATSAAAAQNSTSPEAGRKSSAAHTSTSAKIAIGVVVGVVGLALMVLGFCLFRRWKQKGHSEQVPKNMDTTSTNTHTTSTELFSPQDVGVYAGRDWKPPVQEDYPVPPPKEYELHAVSSPVEMAALEPSRLTGPQGSDAKSNFI